MTRVIGLTVALLVAAGGVSAQTASPPGSLPPDLASHSPPEILAAGSKTLVDIIAILDKQQANVVAMVYGTPVTDGDVADELRSYPASRGYMPMTAIYRTALETVLRQRALAQRARQAGIDKDPVVQRRMAAAADRILVAEYMRHEIEPKITEQALRARYEKDIAGKPGPLEVHLRVIMVPTRDEALTLLQRVKSGQDFATVARDASKDASAPAGGDVGYTTIDSLDPPVGAVAFALNPGEVSPTPIKGGQGWFLIRNEGVRQQQAPSFEAARESLHRELASEAMAAMRLNIPAQIDTEPGKIPIIDEPKPKGQ
jgi:peptidyl-prolyl cis-trans isomerase C